MKCLAPIILKNTLLPISTAQVSATTPRGVLFRTIGRGTGQLTTTPLPQANAYAMIQRRMAAAGIMTKAGNHSFRATGITAYLKNRWQPGERRCHRKPRQHSHDAALRPPPRRNDA